MESLIGKIYKKINGKLYVKIDKSVHFTGKKYISYGSNTMISQNSWLNVNERGNKKRIILGDYCFIGRNNFFSSGELIQFGDYVITSVNCSFLGANHAYENPCLPYMLTSACSDNVIKVGTNVFIGANVTVMGNVSIGMGSLIGANSFIRNMDIPPFSIVVGMNNGSSGEGVLKRYSFIENRWKKIADWTDNDEKSIPTEETYKKLISESLNKRFPTGFSLPLKAVGKSNGNLYN